MKQSDYFKRFKDTEQGEQRELDAERRVRILWIDPFQHKFHLKCALSKRLQELTEEKHPVEWGVIWTQDHYSLRGKLDSIDCCVEIYRVSRTVKEFPDEEFDLGMAARHHGMGSGTEEEQIRKELEPLVDRADWIVYSNCCHEKAAPIAARFGATHPVSVGISFDVAAEMAMDLLRGETEYAECGPDFKKAAELAKQRGDERKQRLYEKWEELKFK